MNILAIDTCCSAATAAVLTDDRLAAEIVQNNKKTHLQNIMPMIDFMMSQAEVSLNIGPFCRRGRSGVVHRCKDRRCHRKGVGARLRQAVCGCVGSARYGV